MSAMASGSALDASVLVLNRLFMAVHVISVRRAFALLCKELAEVVSHEDGQFASYNFTSWREVSEYRGKFPGPAARRGGQSIGDTVAPPCLKCNVRKGGRPPAEAHLTLVRKPEKPKRN